MNTLIFATTIAIMLLAIAVNLLFRRVTERFEEYEMAYVPGIVRPVSEEEALLMQELSALEKKKEDMKRAKMSKCAAPPNLASTQDPSDIGTDSAINVSVNNNEKGSSKYVSINGSAGQQCGPINTPSTTPTAQPNATSPQQAQSAIPPKTTTAAPKVVYLNPDPRDVQKLGEPTPKMQPKQFEPKLEIKSQVVPKVPSKEEVGGDGGANAKGERYDPNPDNIVARGPIIASTTKDGVQAVLQAINNERLCSLTGGGPLELDDDLAKAAQAHANSLVSEGYNSRDPHIGLNGSRPQDRVTAALMRDYNTVYTKVTENIYTEYTGVDKVDWNQRMWLTEPTKAVDAWACSPDHQKTQCDPDITHIGIAYAEGTNSMFKTVWTVVFGEKNDIPKERFPTGAKGDCARMC